MAASAGFSAFRRIAAATRDPGMLVLRMNYVWLQQEQVIANPIDEED
jgi:hypothetical protein